MTPEDHLADVFVAHAAEIIGTPLGAAEIIRRCRSYAVEYNVNIPHTSVTYKAQNKRVALAENIMAFDEPQRYRIIKDLCEHRELAEREEVKALKLRLIARYPHLAVLPDQINEQLIEETRHWLERVPEALAPYTQAIQKYQHVNRPGFPGDSIS